MPTTREEVKRLADALSKKLADEGRLIEGGWKGFELLVIPTDAPEIQRREMRLAFFAGAQHLFSSIMSIMDSDREPTANDMAKMSKINDELAAFAKTFGLRYGPTQGRA